MIRRVVNPAAASLYTEHEWLNYVTTKIPVMMQYLVRYAILYSERTIFDQDSMSALSEPTQEENEFRHLIFSSLHDVPIFKGSIYLPRKGVMIDRFLETVDAFMDDYSEMARSYIQQMAKRHQKCGVIKSNLICMHLIDRCKEYFVWVASEFATKGHFYSGDTDKALERCFITFSKEMHNMFLFFY